MVGPLNRPKGAEHEGEVLVPHPDDVADVRAGLDEVERGELLSEDASAEYLRALLADKRSRT